MGIKTKGVAFNLDDPDQRDLFNYAMTRTNFSAYVKRLIQADQQQKGPQSHVVRPSSSGGIKFVVE
ncbi:hypothetical protein BpsM61_00005 [Bacillus phage vB_BpsM-61]|nr:hypothetical protein BpsM61_00005 [Bacillus phage vB_BpsM-61]